MDLEVLDNTWTEAMSLKLWEGMKNRNNLNVETNYTYLFVFYLTTLLVAQ
jgi:hypothetical protein